MRILVFAVVFVIAAATATASDVIGVYALVDKVVLEPNETAPERIQIWGTFMLADGDHGDGLLPPERGYMYFALPAAAYQHAEARIEWNDLKGVAGTGRAVGFGNRYTREGTAPHVRKPSEKPQTPDMFQLNFGLVQVPRADIVDQLRKAGNKTR